MVTVLLEHIPDISKKDFLGSKAIHYAVKNGDKGAGTALFKAELELSPQTNAITVAALPDETNLQFISKFVSQFPQDFVYHYLKGNALWEKKSYSDAVICYEVSLSLSTHQMPP